MDRPGGSTIRVGLIGKAAPDAGGEPGCCAGQLGQKFYPLEPGWGPPTERDRSTNAACGPTCTACNPEAKVIKPATTVLSKTYYTDSRAYLRARGKRYDQNLGSGSRIPGLKYTDSIGQVLYDNGEKGRANGEYGGLQCPPGSACGRSANGRCASAVQPGVPISQGAPRHTYKPSNRPFAVQGAVESSTRLDRLKLNTIQKAAKSAGVFGAAAQSASRYTGRGAAPRTVKSDWSLAVCRRVSQNKAKCCRMVSNKLGTAPVSRIPNASTGQQAWCADMGRTVFNLNQELDKEIEDDPEAIVDSPEVD